MSAVVATRRESSERQAVVKLHHEVDSTTEIAVSYRSRSKWSVESTDQQGEGARGRGGRAGGGECFCLTGTVKSELHSLRDPEI